MGALKSGASFSAVAKAKTTSLTSRFLAGSSGKSFSATVLGSHKSASDASSPKSLRGRADTSVIGGGGSGGVAPLRRSPDSHGAVGTVAYRVTGLVNEEGGAVDQILPSTPLAQPETILMTAGSRDADTDDRRENRRSERVMAALARYIPAAARESMFAPGRSGRSTHQWLGEIRTCSVVFVNFTGIDYAGEAAVRHVQTAVTIMQRFILQYEGSLRQFLVEDKGSTLIAAFGLPASTHEDDAWRAVMTAMSISRRMAAAGLPNRIGVTTGEAFCGNVGSRKRCEYALYGDVVNTAARFMAHRANEGVLVCETTMKNCASRVDFSDAKPLKLKGKEHEVNAYVPVRSHKPARSSRLSCTSTADEDRPASSCGALSGDACRDRRRLSQPESEIDDNPRVKGADEEPRDSSGGGAAGGEDGAAGRFSCGERASHSSGTEGGQSARGSSSLASSRRASGGSGAVSAENTDSGDTSQKERSSPMKSRGSGDGEAGDADVGGSGGLDARDVGVGATRSSSGGGKPGCELSTSASTSASRYQRGARGSLAKNRFVGRVAERVMLCGKIDAVAATGEGHVIVVEGESGIGKTTLVREVISTVREAGGVSARVLSVSSDSFESRAPYGVLKALMRQLLEVHKMRGHAPEADRRRGSTARSSFVDFQSPEGGDRAGGARAKGSLQAGATRLGAIPRTGAGSAAGAEGWSAELRDKLVEILSDPVSPGDGAVLPLGWTVIRELTRSRAWSRSSQVPVNAVGGSSRGTASGYDGIPSLDDASGAPAQQQHTRSLGRRRHRSMVDMEVSRTRSDVSSAAPEPHQMSPSGNMLASPASRDEAESSPFSPPAPALTPPNRRSSAFELFDSAATSKKVAPERRRSGNYFAGGIFGFVRQHAKRSSIVLDSLDGRDSSQGRDDNRGGGGGGGGDGRWGLGRTKSSTEPQARPFLIQDANCGSNDGAHGFSLDGSNEAGNAEAPESNAGTSSDVVSDLLPLLRPIFGADLGEETRATARLTSMSRAQALCDLIVLIFRRCSEKQPIVIALDDVQWMDTPSWSIVHALSSAKARVALVLITRTTNGASSDAIASKLRNMASPAVSRLRLEGLSSEDTVKVVCRDLNVTSLPDVVAATVVQKSSGNPYFALELTRGIVANGILTVARDGGGGCKLAPDVGANLRLPSSIVGMLRIRLDSLRPRAQLLVKTAAVLGARDIDVALLANAMEDYLTPEEVRGEIAALVALGVMVTRPYPGRDGTVEFANDLMQKVAYSLLPYAARRPVHETAARYRERAEGVAVSEVDSWSLHVSEDSDRRKRAGAGGGAAIGDVAENHSLARLDGELLSTLAYHWGRAGHHQRALSYLVMAGERAMVRFEWREAIVFFSWALEIARESYDHDGNDEDGKDGGGCGDKSSRTTTSYKEARTSSGDDDERGAGRSSSSISARVSVSRQARWSRLIGEARVELGETKAGETDLRRVLFLLLSPTTESGCFGDAVLRSSRGRVGGRKSGLESDSDAMLAAGVPAPRSSAASGGSGGVVNRALLRQLISLAGRRATGPTQPDAVFARSAAAERGDRPTAGRFDRKREDDADADARTFEQASVYIRLFDVYNLAHAAAAATHAAVAAVNAAENGKSLDTLARAYANASLCASIKGLPRVSDLYAARAQRVLRVVERDMMAAAAAADGFGGGGFGGGGGSDPHASLGDTFLTAMMTTPGHLWVYLTDGNRQLGLGRLAEASDAFLLCADASEKAGHTRRWQLALASLAFVASVTGRAARSLAVYRQTFASGHRAGDSRAQAWGLAGMIRLSVSRGAVDDALRLSSGAYDALAAKAGTVDDALCTPLVVSALRGVALLRKCRPGEARTVAEDVLSRLERIGGWPSVHAFDANACALEVLSALLSDALYRGDSRASRALAGALRRLVRVMRGYANVFKLGVPRYWLAAGLCMYLRGDGKGARAAWKRAMDAAAALRWTHEEGVIAREVAFHLPAASRERYGFLIEAGQCFLAEGVEHEFQRVQELLAQEHHYTSSSELDGEEHDHEHKHDHELELELEHEQSRDDDDDYPTLGKESESAAGEVAAGDWSGRSRRRREQPRDDGGGGGGGGERANRPESVHLKFAGPDDPLSTSRDTHEPDAKRTASSGADDPFGAGRRGGVGLPLHHLSAQRSRRKPRAASDASEAEVFDALLRASTDMAMYNAGSTDFSLEGFAEAYLDRTT